jgi:hypothetical protein
MTFKRAADGITKKGKTEGRNLGDSGPTVSTQVERSPKGNPGKTNSNMLKMGRNLAKVASQTRG